jgi:hypothetical protein
MNTFGVKFSRIENVTRKHNRVDGYKVINKSSLLRLIFGELETKFRSHLFKRRVFSFISVAVLLVVNMLD